MKVQITDFQPFSKVELDVEGLTVIVGSSNVGKSALIRAISSALFGRAGDFFVRLGAKFSKVEINGAPGALSTDPTINIEWNKGPGLNQFSVNGELYDKVGTDVPLLIQSAGYRDIPVGNEYLRPQVSEQFDRMFLLDRPGSFVNDTIAQASRLSVLLKADRACSSDLKRNKSLQKIRQADLLQAETKLKDMEPVIEFHAKIQLLKEKFAKLKVLNRRIEDLRSMHQTRKALIEITNLQLPAQTKILEGIGLKEMEAVKLVKVRKQVLTVPPLPDSKPVDIDGIAQLMAKAPELKHLVGEKILHQRYFDGQTITLKSLVQEGEASEAELTILLSSIKVCPTCLRPLALDEVCNS